MDFRLKYTTGIEDENGEIPVLELKLRLTMLMWKKLSKETGLSMEQIFEQIQSQDQIEHHDMLTHFFKAGIETYNRKYKTNNPSEYEDLYELIELAKEGEMYSLFEAIKDSRMTKQDKEQPTTGVGK